MLRRMKVREGGRERKGELELRKKRGKYIKSEYEEKNEEEREEQKIKGWREWW